MGSTTLKKVFAELGKLEVKNGKKVIQKWGKKKKKWEPAKKLRERTRSEEVERENQSDSVSIHEKFSGAITPDRCKGVDWEKTIISSTHMLKTC